MKFSSIAVTAILFATKAEAFAGPAMKPRFALQVRRRRRRRSRSCSFLFCLFVESWLFARLTFRRKPVFFFFIWMMID